MRTPFRFILSLFGRANFHDVTKRMTGVDETKVVSNEPVMKRALKTHIKNLEGEQRVYDAILESFIKTNQFSLSIAEKTVLDLKLGIETFASYLRLGTIYHQPQTLR